MIFSLQELFDIVIMTLAIGFIFKDAFGNAVISDDPLDALLHHKHSNFWFAVLAVAPGIILHELGHKFAAIAYGLTATFHAAYTFLALGVGLKLLNFPFIFFVPAYVSHPATGAVQQAVIAVMGPTINGVLAGLSWLALRYHWFDSKYTQIVSISMTANFFLFILNMLPIPFFDGWSVYSSLWQIFFG